jgi:hypothetical protein
MSIRAGFTTDDQVPGGTMSLSQFAAPHIVSSDLPRSEPPGHVSRRFGGKLTPQTEHEARNEEPHEGPNWQAFCTPALATCACCPAMTGAMPAKSSDR